MDPPGYPDLKDPYQSAIVLDRYIPILWLSPLDEGSLISAINFYEMAPVAVPTLKLGYVNFWPDVLHVVRTFEASACSNFHENGTKIKKFRAAIKDFIAKLQELGFEMIPHPHSSPCSFSLFPNLKT